MKKVELLAPVLADGIHRIAGLTWLVTWVAVVVLFHSPWRELGGLVSETTRYWERVVLAYSAIAGGFVGATVRSAARPGSGRSHAGLLRYVLGLPAALVAVTLVVLRLRDLDDWVGVVSVGFVAWWAGLDACVGAVPLLRGRGYSFTRAIDDGEADEEADRPRLTEDDLRRWR